MINSDIRDQAYRFFVEEAAELLQIIEFELLNLRQDYSKAKIHEIMRAAHSIKGGSASLELDTIKTIAHRLEDYFKALSPDRVEIDEELESLLLQGFDCLKEPLTAQINQGQFDSSAALDKASPIFAALDLRLKDALEQSENYLPSSAELGIDITASIFEIDVPQELERLKTVLGEQKGLEIWREVQVTVGMFAGLAELLNLPGFASIGQAVLIALKNNPEQAELITEVAIANWQEAQQLVLGGDRHSGGSPSNELLAFQEVISPITEPQPVESILDPEFRDQAYRFFIEEATDLLQVIEMGLLSLRHSRTPAKVHEIMRAAHSIKGGSASIGFEAIRTLSHRLEDYFKALYRDEVILDEELETLLLRGFDCLKEPLIEQINTGTHNPESVLALAQPILSQIEERLGDALNQNDEYLPSSADLGVDLIASLFDVDVRQRLDSLASVLEKGSEQELIEHLHGSIELFEGFAQIFNLTGFNTIGEAVRNALNAHPEELYRITELALLNWQQAQAEILAGDYTVGGQVSADLLNFSSQPILDISIDDVFGSNHENQELINPVSASFSLEDVFGSSQSLLEVPSLDEVFLGIPPETPLETPETQVIEEIFVTVADEENSPNLDALLGINTADTAESIESLTEAISAIAQDFAQLPPVKELPKVQVNASNQETPTNRSTVKTDATPAPAALSVRVDFNRLERMNNLVGELAINRNSLSLQNEQLQGSVKELLNRFARFSKITEKLRDVSDQMLIDTTRYGGWSGTERRGINEKGFITPEKSDFDALEMDRYGKLYSTVQGLLEEMIQLEESVDDIVLFARGSNQTLESQRQMLTQLRDELMWARMLPLGEVLNRFPRVLRDLSAKYHKNVRLKLTGTGVLVDKVALEKLYDPLLHLLRNAFDHGIELPEVRQVRNKIAEGLIEIRAYHQGNQTIIEVKDDGGGLNYDKILEQALKRDLISKEQAAVLSKEKISNLIFEPGFSTAEQVSELSGRGVGLDIVRAQLQALKGNVTVASNLGQGTIFTLRLPLTLTIAKLLVCMINASSTRNISTAVAIPSDSIEEIIVPQNDQIKLSGQQRFLQFAGHLIPIYVLGELFEYRCPLPESMSSKALAATVPSPEDWGLPLLILRRGQQLCALEVSRLVSEQELVIKPFGSAIAAPLYTYGCTILGDGTLLPVVNAITLIEQFLDVSPAIPGASLELREVSTDLPPVASVPSSYSQTPTVLVVDDSAALRRTLALTLQKAGYRVLQARDGREALEQLQQNVGIHLVICDVEMPNMNGFEFLGQRRRDDQLMQIPVAMLTSRSSEKHRQLALQLGASAYFTKPYIEQQFLASVKNLIAQTTADLNLSFH
ncbi:hybrid sensor histidine kinase/response regulator [Aphanothece hegewaldii CCALA 016]|uniref:histidine kinase n=1 Tax=Aphanothece hegewaldii CCALA 016 TaxID=2107694 RepID=A0A2T1LUK9_9CHRO|nr:Hpt domain-containing protein [Aphanothece hegewaldii]PSF35249.1 hybrid sensor histidine kinase/response regulator [Aphanothece hegewaldii CCALA 016]